MEAAAQETAEAGATIFGFALSMDFLAPGALFALASTVFGILLKLIKDDRDRIRVFFLLDETPWWAAYARLLGALSSALDRFFGKRLFGWRAFDRCLVLAFIYLFLALMFWLGFFLSVTNAEGQTAIFISVPVLLVAAAIFSLTIRRFRRWIERRKTAAADPRMRWTVAEYVGYFVFGAVVAAGFGVGVDAVGEAIVEAGAVALAIGLVVTVTIGAGIVAVAVAGVLAGSIAGALVLAGVLTVGVVVSGAVVAATPGAADVIIFIFFSLPLVNAALDFPSWGASRWLMRRLERDAERGAWPAIIFHAALDLALAVFFLAALTAICANYLQNLELIPASDWRAIAFFRYAETDPWGAGFWLTAILLSTLVPTVIHLAAAAAR